MSHHVAALNDTQTFYHRYNRNEDEFKAAYPGWATGSTYLLGAINQARERRGAMVRRLREKRAQAAQADANAA